MKIRYKDIKPGDHVRVEFIDSQSPDSPWQTGDSFDALQLNAEVVIEGRVYKRLSKGLLLYGARSKSGEQYGGCWFIPSVSVRKDRIERLDG